MDKEKILEIVNDVKNKPNKDLLSAREVLIAEFTKTKQLTIELTQHLDTVQKYYEKINNEIGNRLK